MSDPFDAIFDEVRSERLPGPFQPAEVIRRRARQRTRRQAVSAGAAVLLVTGLGAGGLAALAGPPGPPVPAPAATPPLVTTPATPTPSPAAPATIPPEWLLTSEDLGPGPWDPPADHDDPEWLEQGWTWACDAEADWGGVDQYPSIDHRLDQTSATWYETDREVNSLWSVHEIVELYETGWGTANVEDVRTALERCAQRPTPGMETAPQFYTVVDEGFAGDESLLIEAETYTFEGATISPEPWYSYVAVMRVGDVVRTISYEPWQRAPVPEAHDHVRELARRAADRL